MNIIKNVKALACVLGQIYSVPTQKLFSSTNINKVNAFKVNFLLPEFNRLQLRTCYKFENDAGVA